MSNPNTSLNKSSNRSDDIDKEVHLLMKKNTDKQKSTYSILEELKSKYKDEEIVDSIMRKYNDKMKRVRKLSEKIKERLVAKYPNLSMKEYIEKITEYKKKYNFDDSEMQSIINLIFLNKSTISNTEALDVNYNEMSKALGFVPASFNLGGKLQVKKEELDQLQMILTIASATKELHNQVTLQSLIYKDCDNVSFQDKFEKNKINIFSFVHPVVAALFIPKIELLDQHMILASIAEIVALKANGQELQTQPEYELYWDIATDPAETACVNKTKPFTDLVNRCNVQTKLWEAVLNLRQGKYYTNDLNSFIMAIDNCRASVFDAADLAYVKDEGTIMRKLLAAFSIRPTIVLTMPVYGITPLTSHISSVTSSHITTLPMITMRIPMTLGQEPESISLNSALSQEQLYIHHRQLTVKQQQILYSREILVFYVHRRYQTINTSRLTNPYNVTALPVTMSAFEKLQQVAINFDFDNLQIGGSNGGQLFNLKSVVMVETKNVIGSSGNEQEMGPEIIISCSALIRKEFDDVNLAGYKYNPLKLDSDGAYVKAMDYSSIQSFSKEAKTKGTLFIYTTKSDSKTIEIFN
jgi:mannitol/fructose-specific phosphotransferase system IIA component (Ntr-type)